MSMTFSPKIEAMLAELAARVAAQPPRVITDEDRAIAAEQSRRRAWTEACKSGDAITADFYWRAYMADETARG